MLLKYGGTVTVPVQSLVVAGFCLCSAIQCHSIDAIVPVMVLRRVLDRALLLV